MVPDQKTLKEKAADWLWALELLSERDRLAPMLPLNHA